MIPNISIQSVIMTAGGFILGYIIRPIIIKEYENYRRSQRQSEVKKENWIIETKSLLAELKILSMNMRTESQPNIETMLKNLEGIEKELYRQYELHPDIDDDINDQIVEVAGHCSAVRTAISDLSYRINDYNGGRIELPFQSDYDSIYVDGDRELIDPKRVLREMLLEMSDDLYDDLAEALEMLDRVDY